MKIYPNIYTTIELTDGRKLGYCEYGNSNGTVILYFHGHPGCCLESGFVAKSIELTTIRLIGIDRPGLGLSTYKKGRKINEWPNDILELLKYLSIDKFSVIGFSGGGPYALSCLSEIPERVNSCCIVSSVGKTNILVSALSMWVPWIVLPLIKKKFETDTAAEKTVDQLVSRWKGFEKDVFSNIENKQILVTSLVGSFSQGSMGAAFDGTLIGSRKWSKNIGDIKHEKVFLWHGKQDDQIPISQALFLTKGIHNCFATYYEKDGHTSTLIRHTKEIIDKLI